MAIKTVTKQPYDSFPVDIDVSDVLDGTKMPTACTSTAVIKDTSTDATATVILSSSYSSTEVQPWVQGGTSGTTYLVTVRFTLSTGERYETEFYLAVVDTPA